MQCFRLICLFDLYFKFEWNWRIGERLNIALKCYENLWLKDAFSYDLRIFGSAIDYLNDDDDEKKTGWDKNHN